ncbi:MAG TPA: pyrroline-5-carboxylate reductase [Planctomycetaceae bacterium]|nr:pyrroline-5-carboxylate reductase [Planctomycetaceae bacterium]
MSTDVSHLRVGFIGAGQMATALARGLVTAQVIPASAIVAADPVPASVERFARDTGGRAVASNAEVVRGSDVVFLAVKPQQMLSVLTEISTICEPRHLVVSVAAGITLATLDAQLAPSRRVIRVMPNTPCLIGRGASAFSTGLHATRADAAVVERLLSTVGVTGEVPEKLLDAVTGLSGSGPAYVYLMIEALSDGGVRAGLPRELALKLAAQTVLGAAEMVLTTGQHPGALKDAVTSPGGTTIAGLHKLEQSSVRGALMDAVVAATDRARELSGKIQ